MDTGLQFSQAFTVNTSHAVPNMNVYILCLYQIVKMLVCIYATRHLSFYFVLDACFQYECLQV